MLVIVTRMRTLLGMVVKITVLRRIGGGWGEVNFVIVT